MCVCVIFVAQDEMYLRSAFCNFKLDCYICGHAEVLFRTGVPRSFSEVQDLRGFEEVFGSYPQAAAGAGQLVGTNVAFRTGRSPEIPLKCLKWRGWMFGLRADFLGRSRGFRRAVEFNRFSKFGAMQTSIFWPKRPMWAWFCCVFKSISAKLMVKLIQ